MQIALHVDFQIYWLDKSVDKYSFHYFSKFIVKILIKHIKHGIRTTNSIS